MKYHRLLFILVLLASLSAATVLAQSGQDANQFDSTGFTVSNGGGTSSGGAYTLNDALGQSVAGEMSGDNYALNSGYLSGALTVKNLVLLYINGDNNLSSEMLNLARKAQAGAVAADAVTFMVLDGPGQPDSYLYRLDRKGDTNCDFYADYTCSGHYLKDYNVWTFNENLGAPETLTQFIVNAIQTYPNAQHITLSLAGHGGGWSPNLLAGQPKDHVGQPDELGGLLWDDHPGDSLSTPALGKALRDAYNATHRKIDLLYLDACLMGMWEVAYEVHDSVHYLLASESWSWTSHVYDKHLSSLSGMQTVSQIGQTWLQDEANDLKADYPYTFSLIDLDQMPALTTALNQFATVLSTTLSTDKAKVENAFLATDCFDNNADYVIDRLRDHTAPAKPGDNYCDLDSFTRQITTTFNSNSSVVSAALALQAALKQAVLSEEHQNGIPADDPNIHWAWGKLGGLSIYLPLNSAKDDWKRRFYHQMQSSKDSLWDDFITAYWNQADPPVVPDCADPCSLPRGPLLVEDKLYLPLIRR